MKIFALLATSTLSVLLLFIAMNSLVTVDSHFDSSLVNGNGFTENNSQITTEIYMPYYEKSKYNPTVSFLDDYNFLPYGDAICMCCGSRAPKPQFNLDDYQDFFEEVTPLNREEIAILFNFI